MMTSLRLATRASPLALWQANHVADLLRHNVPQVSVELVKVTTAGDQHRDESLSQIGGEGLFTKEIQRAVLEHRADIAVHSLKDLPTSDSEGLILAAVPPRGPSADVMVSSRYGSFAALPPQATVATSSPRRRAQLLFRRPDLRVAEMRGNVETRLRKLTEQSIDALVLAQAGLERLGLRDSITEILDPSWMLPAVGQGALALECRVEDQVVCELLGKLNDPPTAFAVRAERAMLRALGGGCRVPIGAASNVDGDSLRLRGGVLSPNGTSRIEAQIVGQAAQCESLGRQLADELLAGGAAALLASTSP